MRRLLRHFLERSPSMLLGTLAAAFLVGAVWVGYRVIVRHLDDPSLTVAALLATIAGLFLTVQRQIADRQEATSRFYLEQFQKGFDTAYDILDSVPPGDPLMRMKWIAAARVLATAHSMFEKI